MKQLILPVVLIVLCSCNSNSTGTNDNVDPSVTSPDTTIHPNGVNEGAVISTDTAAYTVGDSTK